MGYIQILIEGQCSHMVRAAGIEPATPAWKAGVLPLNYARGEGVCFLQRGGVGQGYSGWGRGLVSLRPASFLSLLLLLPKLLHEVFLALVLDGFFLSLAK